MDQEILASEYICEPCRSIDFGKALELLGDGILGLGGILLDEHTTRFTTKLPISCNLCKLLSTMNQWDFESPANSNAQDTASESFDLRAFSYLQCSDAAGSKLEDAQDSLMLSLTPKTQKTFDAEYFCSYGADMFGCAVCLPRHIQPKLFQPQVIPEAFDHQKARLWISNCREYHGVHCAEKIPTLAIPEMKLIDCETLQVVRAGRSMQWVALSYRWEPHMASTATHAYTQVLEQSSASVKDAIAVTKLLGYRYLWVDKYCIDQSDTLAVESQIQKMGFIYRNAELTIVAAAGPDERYGLPGVGSTRRLRQQVMHLDNVTVMSSPPNPAFFVERNSQWWKRGWTLQEGVMSRRRLIFTEHQAFYECGTLSWTEHLGGLEHITNPQSISWPSWKFGHHLLSHHGALLHEKSATPETESVDSITGWQFHHFFRFIQQYTTRDLTFDKDSLKAASGILGLLASGKTPIFHLVGLPYVSVGKGDELAKSRLFAALSWYHKSGNAARRRADFPSWTWAGWAGAIRWMSYPSGDLSRTSHDLHTILLESVNGTVSPASDYLQLKEAAGNHPDSAVAIHFEARLVPPSLIYIARDPRDWSQTTINGQSLLKGIQPPTETPDEFVQHLNDGTWACLLLGDFLNDSYSNCLTFMLVVQWQGSETATRTGALVVDSRQKRVWGFEKADLPWVKVRLV